MRSLTPEHGIQTIPYKIQEPEGNSSNRQKGKDQFVGKMVENWIQPMSLDKFHTEDNTKIEEVKGPNNY